MVLQVVEQVLVVRQTLVVRPRTWPVVGPLDTGDLRATAEPMTVVPPMAIEPVSAGPMAVELGRAEPMAIEPVRVEPMTAEPR